MTLLRLPALIAAVLLLLPDPSHADAPVIGALAELSGPYSRMGEDCRKGYELAGSLSGSPSRPRMIIADNRSDPKAAIAEYRRLVDTENARIVVTTRSPVGLALNPLSLQRRLPLVGVVGHPRFIADNPYAVRIFPSAGDEGAALARAVERSGSKRIALVSLEDDYFVALSKELKRMLRATDTSFSESVPPNEQDFSSLVTRLRGKSPDAVFVNLGPAQIAPFVRRLRDVHLDVQLFGNFLAGSPDVRSALGETGNGMIFVELDYARPGFLGALEKKFGTRESSPIGYSCYVAMQYALEFAEKAEAANGNDGAVKIEGIPTLDGMIPVENREAHFEVSSKQIVRGEVVTAQDTGALRSDPPPFR